MKNEYTLVETKTGTCYIEGISDSPKNIILSENKDYLIIKTSGYTYASGQSRPYAQPEVFVIKKLSDWKDHWLGQCVTVEGYSGLISADMGKGYLKKAQNERQWNMKEKEWHEVK